jgi:hypothetical protein
MWIESWYGKCWWFNENISKILWIERRVNEWFRKALNLILTSHWSSRWCNAPYVLLNL